MNQIIESSTLNELWNRYIDKNQYANEVTFSDIIVSIKEILSKINW